ncbi:MAG: precorrin-2 C(20)-methyltransferase [Nitrospirota bacterium]|nr:precorrin-2 C(20)-methyltransferase [Nitrospirota bacterium]
MTGKLYVIGIGPGDPELLTLKAVRILREVSCICVPKGKEEGSSIALSVAEKALKLDNKEIIEAHFPMRKTKESQGTEDRIQSTVPPPPNPLPQGEGGDSNIPSPSRGEGEGGGESLISNLCQLDEKWNETVENVLSRLNKGIDMAFLTIGDPTIYSTFFYLYDKLLELNPEINIEIIPGVSSINTAAARAGLSLGLADEKIAILPATYADDVKETLEKFDTVILMKVHSVFDKVLNILSKMNLTDNAVYVSRAGMDDEKIFRNIRSIKKEDLNYFSLMIIKK